MTRGQVSAIGTGSDSKAVIVGVTLMGIGGAFIAAGLALSGVAIVTGLRKWVDEMEQSPTEVARQTWAQAKAATSAGARAWQDEQALHHAARELRVDGYLAPYHLLSRRGESSAQMMKPSRAIRTIDQSG